MRKVIISLFIAVLCCTANSVIAADVLLKFSIYEALNDSKVSEVLNDRVALYWGEQQYPTVKNNYGLFKSSKRTNALGKTKEEACRWALASAVKALQERATKEGGNAVINITSNIKNAEYSSKEDYECLAGSFVVNVALKGDVVTIGDSSSGI